MKTSLNQVEILNLHKNEYENATLCEGISQNHLNDFKFKWSPPLTERAEEIIQAYKNKPGNFDESGCIAELAQACVLDFHWNWCKKHEKYCHLLQYQSFALECNGETQGLMYVNLGERCHIASQKNLPLVYVEYVATAPWNRRKFTQEPQYRYVGDVLIATAISLSINEEFQGRIGLHSLPGADDFYSKHVGMECLGVTEKSPNLNYYELTPSKANKFLNYK